MDGGVGAVAVGAGVISPSVAVPPSSAMSATTGFADAMAGASLDAFGVDTGLKPSVQVSLGSTPQPNIFGVTGVSAYKAVQAIDNNSITMNGVTVAANSNRSQFSVSLPNGSTYYVMAGLAAQNGMDAPADKELQDMIAMMMLKLMSQINNG